MDEYYGILLNYTSIKLLEVDREGEGKEEEEEEVRRSVKCFINYICNHHPQLLTKFAHHPT